MGILLTDEELEDDRFDGLSFDMDDIKWVLETQLKKVVEWLKGKELLEYPGLSAIPPNCYYIDKDDWQALLKEAGLNKGVKS